MKTLKVRRSQSSYLLYEIQSPVPVVMAGQDVGPLESNSEGVRMAPRKQPAVADVRPLPASPSLCSGGNSSPCPLPPSSRTRGPPSGRPRRPPGSQRGPATVAREDTQGGGATRGPSGAPLIRNAPESFLQRASSVPAHSDALHIQQRTVWQPRRCLLPPFGCK